MRHTTRTAAVVLAMLAVAAVPAITDEGDVTALDEGCRLVDVAGTPEDATDDVTICEELLYIRAGAAPVSNVASAVFSADAPTTPGLGGVALGGSGTDLALQGDPMHGLEVSGTFTGAVDTVDINVYAAMPNAATASHGATPAVVLNGWDVAGALIDATVVPGPAGSGYITISISGLLPMWQLAQFSNDVDAENTIRVNLSPYYIGDDGAYLYDGTDVPSNVVLNAAS